VKPYLGRFRLPLPSQDDLLGLAVVLLVVILALTIWLAMDAWHDRQRRIRKLRHVVADKSLEKHLNADEARLFERIALRLGAYPGFRGFEEQADRLLRKGVDAEVLRSVRDKMGYGNPPPGHHLFSSRACSVGQDVTLTDARHVWKAGVIAVDERALTLKVPDDAARTLKPDAEVKVSFWRELDARYFFITTVRYANDKPVPIVRLDHAMKMDRYQDREFYRADVDWTLDATRIDAATYAESLTGRAPAAKGEPLALRLADISPGGFRVLSVPGLGVQDHLVVTVPVSGHHAPLVVHARVIALEPNAIRCEFLGLTLQEQDAIHHEILKKRRGGQPGSSHHPG
jgi:hypothetical protein